MHNNYDDDDDNNNNNKSAKSDLGKGPRRCESLHVRRRVPIGYNGAPQIRPQKYTFPCTDPQTMRCFGDKKLTTWYKMFIPDRVRFNFFDRYRIDFENLTSTVSSTEC